MRVRDFSSSYDLVNGMFAKHTEDIVTENFKERVRNGELINNPFNSWKISVTPRKPLGYIYKRRGRVNTQLPWGGWTEYTNNMTLPTPALASTVWPSGTYGKALGWASSKGFAVPPFSSYEASVAHTALSAELASGITSSLVSILEGGETLRMLRDGFRLLRHPIVEARKALKISRQAFSRDASKRQEAWDYANNAWLQGRYGWRPFVYDIMSIHEATTTEINSRTTVRKKLSVGGGEFTYTAATTPIANVRCDIVCDGYISPYYRFGQTADYGSKMNLSAFKWGFLDPIGTAWDVIPYSFVVDWFLNIGDALKSVQTYWLTDERIGWSNLIAEIEAHYRPVCSSTGGVYGSLQEYQFVGFTDPSWEWKETFRSTYRLPVGSFMPALTAGVRLDLPKIVDLAALLRGVTRR